MLWTRGETKPRGSASATMHKELKRRCQGVVRGRGAVAEGGSVAGPRAWLPRAQAGPPRSSPVRWLSLPRAPWSRQPADVMVRARGRPRRGLRLCPLRSQKGCGGRGGRLGAAAATALPRAALTRLRPCPLRRPRGHPTPAAPSAPRRRAGRCRTANVQLSSTSSRRHPSAPVRCARPQRGRAAVGSVVYAQHVLGGAVCAPGARQRRPAATNSGPCWMRLPAAAQLPHSARMALTRVDCADAALGWRIRRLRFALR